MSYLCAFSQSLARNEELGSVSEVRWIVLSVGTCTHVLTIGSVSFVLPRIRSVARSSFLVEPEGGIAFGPARVR